MIVLDTHAWIWNIVAPSRLSRRARSVIDSASEIGLSTISFWELAVLSATRRLELDRDPRTWIRVSLGADPRLRPLPVSAEIALRAGGLATVRDPGDSIIYATAVARDAPLVSRDQRLRDLDPARVVW